MKKKIFPCLWFDGKAADAARYYCSIFDNSEITAESPIVVSFELSGHRFMALNGGPEFSPNPSISFFVICESVEEVDKYYESLVDGGSFLMPLDKYPWSPRYAWVQDKYGVNWQLMLGDVAKTGGKFIPALMYTGDQAGKAEQAINHYTSLFKDSGVLEISRYTKDDHDVKGTVKHGRFQLYGQTFVAMDSSFPHKFRFSKGISLVVECENQQEIDHFWNGLTKGGKESMCGWLKDQYGVSWQVVPAILGELMSDPDKAGRVAAAFMKMKKLEIEKLIKS
jgi:predicted 3-demethylubiquinone-9 3-methyltransferase (glyoxalase superfamily)